MYYHFPLTSILPLHLVIPMHFMKLLGPCLNSKTLPKPFKLIHITLISPLKNVNTVIFHLHNSQHTQTHVASWAGDKFRLTWHDSKVQVEINLCTKVKKINLPTRLDPLPPQGPIICHPDPQICPQQQFMAILHPFAVLDDKYIIIYAY